MATLTGSALLESVLELTGAQPTPMFQDAMAQRLQEAINAGITSNLALTSILMTNKAIRESVPEGESTLPYLMAIVSEAKQIDRTFNLTDVGPEVDTVLWYEDGVIQYDLALEYFAGLAGLDLVDLGILDQDGNIVFEGDVSFATAMGIENITFIYGDLDGSGDGSGNDVAQANNILIEMMNGTTFTSPADVSLAYLEFLRDMILNPDFYEQWIATYEPAKLTPTESRGVVEEGFTGNGNDTIIAGRLELLHGAYIDGGGGYDTLEVDAKGMFAQPEQLLSIERVNVQNMPNVYPRDIYPFNGDPVTTDFYEDADLADSIKDYFDDVNFTYPLPNGLNPANSILDLSRASSLQYLVVSETPDMGEFGSGNDLGTLTVMGIRNGVTTLLEGGFTEDVYLHYGRDVTSAITLDLKLGDTEGMTFYVAHNANSLNLNSLTDGTSTLSENWLEDAYFGGSIRELNIAGDAALYIEGDLYESFHADRPATIDASENTAGVDLNITHDNVHFIGTTGGNDVFTAEAAGYNNTLVIIDGGEGMNQYVVEDYDTVVVNVNGEDVLTVVNWGSSTHEALLEISMTGSASDLIFEGSGNDLVAEEGSFIEGGDINIHVMNETDLADAQLSGISNIELYSLTDHQGLIPTLTISADQFEDLGPDIFSVYMGRFNDAVLNVEVADDFDLSAMDLSGMDSSLFLNFDVLYGATLTITAEQLDKYVEEEGIVLGPNGGLGKVIVTNAGNNFNPFDNDWVGAPEWTYDKGGTILNNWESAPPNGNVTVQRVWNGYDRDSVNEYNDAMVIDTTEGPLEIGANALGNPAYFNMMMPAAPVLVIQGDNEITFTAPLQFANKIADGYNFTIDFSGLNAETNAEDIDWGLTIANFENITDGENSSWGKIVGNDFYNRIEVMLEGNVGAEGIYSGLKSEAVEQYIVTGIVNENGQFAAEERDFYVCVNTQDLDSLGLQGNYNGTINFHQVQDGVHFLMETAYHKSYGAIGNGYVGNLVGNFQHPGATAWVEIMTHDVWPDGEAIVRSITVNNAKTLTVNVVEWSDADTYIERIDGDVIEAMYFASPNDLKVEGPLEIGKIGDVTSINEIDASQVEGDFIWLVRGTNDLSNVVISGFDQVVFHAESSVVTLKADQIIDDVGEFITGDAAGTNGTLNVTDLGEQPLDLSAIDVGNIGTVTIADQDLVILHADTNLGMADEVVIQAQTGDTTLQMSVEQYLQLMDAGDMGDVNFSAGDDPVTGDAYEASLVLTDLEEDSSLDLDSVDDDIGITIRIDGGVDGFVATEDFEILNAANLLLEVAGDVDLTEGELGGIIDVHFIGDATLNLTAAQVVTIQTGAGGFTAEDGVNVTLNIVDLDDEVLDLGAIQEEGINIGQIVIAEETDVVLDVNTTLGGADSIYIPEDSTLTMTAEQFMQLDGIGGTVEGDGTLNITDLTQDQAGIDLSNVTALNGWINLGADAEAVVQLTEDADLNGFAVRLLDDQSDGQTIIFAKEEQADGRNITVWTDDVADGIVQVTGGDSPLVFANTNVAWLFNAITLNGGQLDTAAYSKYIGQLWVNDELVDGQNEEDLWTYLYSEITVRVVNTDELDEALLPPINRHVLIESFTDLSGGLIFDDPNELQFVQRVIFDLGGMVNLGDIVIDNSANNPTFIANDKFQGLFIFSANGEADRDRYYPEDWDGDLHADVSDYVDAVNKVGDIHLAETSTNTLLSVTLNTWGAFAGGAGTGLALEVGTITYASNPNPEGVLNLSGDNSITIEAVDFSDPDVTLVTVNNGTDALVEVIIGGYEYTAYNTVYMMDNHVAEAGDVFGDAGDVDLIEVVNGDVDLTLADTAEVDELYVSGDSTITMTAAQVAGIGVTEFSVAAGVNVTLNITDLSNQELDLNVLQDAGFNIGDITILEDYQGALHADTTLGGAAQIILQDEDTELSLTAAQFMGLEGPGTIVGPGTVNITDLTNDESDIDLSEVSAVNGKITLDEDDVTLATWDEDAGEWVDAAILNGFSIELEGKGVAVNDLLGQTIRFANAEQAQRDVDVTGTVLAAQGTNVVWLFDEIDLPAGKVDTSGYDSDLGRLWMLDTLVDGANVEDLFTTLSGDIIIRVVNSADLAELLPENVAFDRTVEIEAFTQLPGGLTFNDIDDADANLFQHIENLTLDLGGQVNMGDLLLDNILGAPTANSPDFDTLTINSYLADVAGHYLLPETWVDGVNPLPTGPNVIGNIDSGPDRDQLLNVVLNADEVALQVETITFAGAAGATANLTAEGNFNVTVKSVNTTDVTISVLEIDNTGAGAALITGGSPAAAVADTETLEIETTAGDVILGSMVDPLDPTAGYYAGVYGPELSTINATVNGAGDIDLGVIAAIDGSLATPGNVTTGFNLNKFGTGAGTVEAVLGQAVVNGANVAPELAAGDAWQIQGVDLTITDDVVFNAGGTLILDNVALTIDGDVDLSILGAGDTTADPDEPGLILNGTTIEVPAGSTLTLTAEQADGVTVTGGGTVEILNLEADVDPLTAGVQIDADLSNIMTGGTDTGVVNAYLDTSDADGDTIPEDIEMIAGSLGVAHVEITGDGSFQVTGAGEIGTASFTVGVDATLNLTADQAHERVADGDGTVNVADLGAQTAPNDTDLSGLTAGTVNAAVDTDVTLTADADLGTAVVTVANGITLTAPASVLDGKTINGEGTVEITGDATGADFSNFGIETIEFDAGATVVNVTFPELYGDPAGTDPVQEVILTAAQADGETILGADGGNEGRVTVNALGADEVDFSNIDAGEMTANVPANAILDPNTDLGDFEVTVDGGFTLILTGEQADGRVITGDGNVVITDVQPGQDFGDVNVNGDLTLLAGAGVTELTLSAAQADGAIVDGPDLTKVTITDLDQTPDADLTSLRTGMLTVDYDLIVELDSSLDVSLEAKFDTAPALVPDAVIELSGNGTVTVEAAADLGSAVIDVVAGTPTLVLAAADADLLTLTENGGTATVNVTALEGTPGADLTGIEATTGTAELDSDATGGAVTLSAQLGDNMVVTIEDSTGSAPTVTFTGTMGTGSSIVIADDTNLTMTAAVADDITVDAGVDGTVEITVLEGTPAANLAGITGTVGNITATSGTVTFTGDLGMAEVTVTDGATFTADVTVLDGKTVQGDSAATDSGNVAATGLAGATVNLGGIAAGAGTRVVTLLDDTVTTAVTLDSATDLGAFDVNSGGTVTDFTLSAAQADDRTVTDGGALTDVFVTAFEDTPGADLVKLDSANYTINVSLDTSAGDVEIGDTADLSKVTGVTSSEVTISGTNEVTVADGAHVANTEFVVEGTPSDRATLVADQSLAATSVIDGSNVSGGGALLFTGLGTGGAAITLTQNLRISQVEFIDGDHSATINSFTAGIFNYDGPLNPGVHQLDFTDYFADPTIDWLDVNATLAEDQTTVTGTGVSVGIEILSFSVAAAINKAAVEAAFADTGVFDQNADGSAVTFDANAEKIFLISDGTNTDIYHWTDGVRAVDEAVGAVNNDGLVTQYELTLLGTLSNVDITGADVLIEGNFILA